MNKISKVMGSFPQAGYMETLGKTKRQILKMLSDKKYNMYKITNRASKPYFYYKWCMIEEIEKEIEKTERYFPNSTTIEVCKEVCWFDIINTKVNIFGEEKIQTLIFLFKNGKYKYVGQFKFKLPKREGIVKLKIRKNKNKIMM